MDYNNKQGSSLSQNGQEPTNQEPGNENENEIEESEEIVPKTSFEEIYKLFLNSIQDYSIRNLFIEEVHIAMELMEYFLLRAIPKFRACEKDLQSYDANNKCFNVELDLEEKTILAELMVLSWIDRVVNDIAQMNLSISDSDFKHYSEEKNLKEKSMYGDRLREKVSQEMTNYLLYRTPFSRWAVGDFGV